AAHFGLETLLPPELAGEPGEPDPRPVGLFRRLGRFVRGLFGGGRGPTPLPQALPPLCRYLQALLREARAGRTNPQALRLLLLLVDERHLSGVGAGRGPLNARRGPRGLRKGARAVRVVFPYSQEADRLYQPVLAVIHKWLEGPRAGKQVLTLAPFAPHEDH